jgi:hypothetical protein
MGCLYALLTLDFLAWGGFAAVGGMGGRHDPYRALHDPYYFHLPATVALVVLTAVALARLGSRSARLAPAIGPVGLVVGLICLVGLLPYLFFYTGGM